MANQTEIDRLRKAVRFIKEAHKGQFRKFARSHVPYYFHCIEVALDIAEDPTSTIEDVITGLTHDVDEDTKYTIKDIAIEFGDEVASNCRALTNSSKGSSAPRDERKRQDREKLSECNHRIQRTKFRDRNRNLLDLINSGAPYEYIRKYSIESLLLADAMKDADDYLYAKTTKLACNLILGCATINDFYSSVYPYDNSLYDALKKVVQEETKDENF